MTSESLIGAEYYQLAWLIYILAGIGLLICFWQVIKFIKSKNLKGFIIAFLSCGIFTPAWETGEQGYFAPAILVGAFDFLDGMDKGVNFALNVLAKALLPMILLMLLFACIFITLNILEQKKIQHSSPSTSKDGA